MIHLDHVVGFIKTIKFGCCDNAVMLTVELGKVLMNTDDKRSDPLTVIDGIGVERRKTLGNEFDINSIQDLAQCSTETAHAIVSRLRGVSYRDVDIWIATARQIAAGAEEQALQPSDAQIAEMAEAESSVQGRATHESLPQQGAIDRTAWRDVVSVVVNFQARQSADQPEERRISAHRIQNGGRDAEFHDFDYQGLCQWMSEQIGKIQGQQPEDEALTSNRLASKAITKQVRPVIETIRIQAFQPPVSEQPVSTATAGEEFSKRIESDSPFSLEISFALSEAAVAALGEAVACYRARFYAHAIATRGKVHLGDSEPKPLIQSRLTYVGKLTSATLSPGFYHLRAIVELQTEPPSTHFIEIPFLYVA